MIRIWKNASLRTQLVAIISALLAISLLALGATTYVLLRSFLQDQMDAQLQTYHNSIAKAGISPADTNGNAAFAFDYYVRYCYDDGTVFAQNRLTEAKPAMGAYSLRQATDLSRRGPFTVPSSDGQDPWRTIIVSPANIRGQTGDGIPVNFTGYVVVALPYKSLNSTMDRLAAVIAGVALAAVILGILIAYWTVSRSFRPLSRVEKTAAAIAAGDLSRRVEIENPTTEVGRLSGSLNAMLAHIESAFAARTASERQMRRFVADASHELRTPLVTIRGFSELYRHGALASSDDVATAMGRIESEAKRMGELVEDLLMLARIDEQRPLQRKPVDMLLLAHDATLDARASARDRDIRVVGLHGGPGTSAPTSGDEAKLRQVVTNLMGNSLRYTPEGTPVEVAVGTEQIDGRPESVLQVRDHGPGISEEEAPRIFERFYRADSSRNRDTGGSGLGLAIVSAIVASHEGTVRLSQTPGGGATLTIRLPFRDPGEPTDTATTERLERPGSRDVQDDEDDDGLGEAEGSGLTGKSQPQNIGYRAS